MVEQKPTELARLKFWLRSLKNHKMHLEAQVLKASFADPTHLRCEIDRLTTQIALLSK